MTVAAFEERAAAAQLLFPQLRPNTQPATQPNTQQSACQAFWQQAIKPGNKNYVQAGNLHVPNIQSGRDVDRRPA